MARILEAFKQAESRRPRPEPSVPLHAAPVQPEADDADMPYIEVGGPNRAVEGSPDVLQSAGRNGHHEPPARPAATTGEEDYTRVAFRPLPAEPLRRRPAYERFAAELVAFHQPEHPSAEQYRSLYLSIEAQLPEGSSRVVLFTGTGAAAGTTTVLLNLAITSARQSGLRVIVVDANLRRPAIADRLGLRDAPGLCDVLQGRVAPQRALQETGEAGVLALPAGNPDESDLVRLNEETLRSIVRILRSRFDLVLVDAPSWAEHPETVALASVCDVVYLVTPQETADAPAVKTLLQTIPQQGGRLRGTILTQR